MDREIVRERESQNALLNISKVSGEVGNHFPRINGNLAK